MNPQMFREHDIRGIAGQDMNEADAISPYRAFLKENIRLDKPMWIGVGAGNGIAGVVAVPILCDHECEVHDLYCEIGY
jgi:phosphomannomutase/phosphoglucomutase